MLFALPLSRMVISRPLFYHYTNSKLDQCSIIGGSCVFISLFCSPSRRENTSSLPEYMLSNGTYFDECKLKTSSLLYIVWERESIVARVIWLINLHLIFHTSRVYIQHLLTNSQLGFIVPLGAKPKQCFNEITPNDMSSNVSCALSGAFLIAGGWAGVMWVFLRAVALHLQICWQMIIGKTFMWGALATGWGIPAIGLTVALVFSGVSFRFGDTCHINHTNSLADLWIPLLIFAGVTVIIQFATFGYCIKVYLQSLSDDSTTTDTSGLPSYTNSVRGTISPKQAYRRVRRVIELQWRGIAIVLLIIADVVFFAVVFVFMDDTENSIVKNPGRSLPWLACLVKTQGDKNTCLPLASNLVVNEATVTAVLLLLSVSSTTHSLCWSRVLTPLSSTVSGVSASSVVFPCSQAGTISCAAVSSLTPNSSALMCDNSKTRLTPTKCFPRIGR